MEFIDTVSNLNIKNINNYLDKLKKNEINNLLTILDEKYYNGEALVEDKIYDKIQNY